MRNFRQKLRAVMAVNQLVFMLTYWLIVSHFQKDHASVPEWAAVPVIGRIWMFVFRVFTWPARIGK